VLEGLAQHYLGEDLQRTFADRAADIDVKLSESHDFGYERALPEAVDSKPLGRLVSSLSNRR